MNTVILYSFRRCPYCMRAHMALKYAGIKAELREVDLKALPDALLNISSSNTVPVLLVHEQPDAATVLDESWDIVKWSLQQNDPDNWLGKDGQHLLDAEILVETNDFSFKTDLDHYKYADRHPEHPVEYYRELCEEFIQELEDKLVDNRYLLADSVSLADIAVFPFVRQFSLVDKSWFEQPSYRRVQRWLAALTSTGLFENVFQKFDNWKAGDDVIFI